MTRIEITEVQTLTYRQVSHNGVASTEIEIRDLAGCETHIVLHHDGRARMRRQIERKS